ncbi:MAG: ABC transporter permease [Gemmatimonadota bacterium]|nr:ABC transporter permease [Gemmatimonadota bacterium]
MIRAVALPSRRVAGFVVLTLLAFTAAMSGMLCMGGFSAWQALAALWAGSLGSWYSITSATMVRAVPLMLTGCAVAVAFKAGVFNIGAEGQLIVGAAAAACVALWLPHAGALGIVAALAAGCVAGGAWAGLAAMLRTRFGVLEVISTIMLNFVALHGVSYLVRGPLQEPTRIYPQSSTIADSLHLPRFVGAGRLHVGIVVAITLLLVCGWIFRFSAAGFRLRSVGESPAASASAGLIDVRRTTMRAFLASGALAGLAGAIEVLGVTFALYENISPGYGYTAIAVALLASLDPWRIALSATLFAALEAGASAMQRDAGIPAAFVSIIEASMILAVVGAQAVRFRFQAAPEPRDAGSSAE